MSENKHAFFHGVPFLTTPLDGGSMALEVDSVVVELSPTDLVVVRHALRLARDADIDSASRLTLSVGDLDPRDAMGRPAPEKIANFMSLDISKDPTEPHTVVGLCVLNPVTQEPVFSDRLDSFAVDTLIKLLKTD